MEQAKSQLHDTLFVTLRGTSSPLYAAETKKLFEKYGDVKAVRDCPKSPGLLFFSDYVALHSYLSFTFLIILLL